MDEAQGKSRFLSSIITAILQFDDCVICDCGSGSGSGSAPVCHELRSW
uniref:Uncharacterized protein n=1 Tax=Arundo donax TaxID=35708 RepID=A0A0A9AYQ8_ARUDO